MEEKIERTFATPEGCHLVVENIRGEIVVQGWDRPETEIVALCYKEGTKVEITQEGNKVIARTRNSPENGEQGASKWLNWLTPNRAPVVDYSVHVPFASKVKVKNVKGPIHVKQTQGKVRVNNVDGPATVEEVDGDARIETVNGALHVAQLEGAADLKTVNGEMHLAGGNLSKLSAQTVNGNIKITATLDDKGQYTFNTVNGNCELHLPNDFRARVSANGVNLRVDCTQPAQSVEKKFGSWQGAIGPDADAAPQAEIAFHTVNGHLSIDNGESAAGTTAEPVTEYVAKAEMPAVPPEPPETEATIQVKAEAASPVADETDKPQPKSQIEILQMIERGEVTVEEAVKLMEEL